MNRFPPRFLRAAGVRVTRIAASGATSDASDTISGGSGRGHSPEVVILGAGLDGRAATKVIRHQRIAVADSKSGSVG